MHLSWELRILSLDATANLPVFEQKQDVLRYSGMEFTMHFAFSFKTIFQMIIILSTCTILCLFFKSLNVMGKVGFYGQVWEINLDVRCF